MEYVELGESDGVPIRVPTSESYRICSVCGGDCAPDPEFSSDEHGARIAYRCPDHGIQSLVDPFEGRR